MAQRSIPSFLAGLLTLSLWLSCDFRLSAGNDVEARVKAAYLFNIAKFTEWPDSKLGTKDAQLVIGCFCDPAFAGVLERTVAGKTAGTRRIAVRRIAGAEEVRACHILFIGASQSNVSGPLLARAKEASVLSVGEVDGFLSRGGMINFYDEDNTVHFEVNPKTAEKAGLTLSSRLLTVARIAR